MSVFLTPDGRPFYGGTYFPNEPRHGIPSFRLLLARISEVWVSQRDELEASATKLAEHVRAGQALPTTLLEAVEGQPEPDPQALLKDATTALHEAFDARNGGWGGAPKFPQSSAVELLLREHLRTGDDLPMLMLSRTLDAMAIGGIYDHLGGGFARYATDATWLVPHFEKMLYDNAQLARVYLHAWQVTGETGYARVAAETLDFMAHELRNPADGAFASSLDADTDGVEGATYTWEAAEVRALLGDDAALFEAAYGVIPAGNWEGRTILNRTQGDTALAAAFSRPREEVDETLTKQRMKLLRARDERPQPARDDKVLTSWNGLAIAAFAEAGRALDDEGYTRIGTEAAGFVLRELRTADGRLLRSWKDGQAQHAAVLEDHAHLAEALLTLYEATFEERWFIAARDLAELMLRHFRADDSGFVDTADDAESLIARTRSPQDSALPSGGASAVLVLLRLAALTGESRYRDVAEAAIRPMAPVAARHPTAFAAWLLAYQMASAPIHEVAIVGDPAAADTQALLATARARYRPGQVMAASPAPEASAIPLLQGRSVIDGRATAYVCHGFTCQRPAIEPQELATQLEPQAK
jgi:uncharacterized protein YyaL (SSP411 family)